MNIENLTEEEEKILKASNKKVLEPKENIQHYGPAENMSESDLEAIERANRANIVSGNTIHQHYGSVENMNESDTAHLVAANEERIKNDKPHKDYLKQLIINPEISNDEQFNSAVKRSIQSNGVMKNFVSKLVEEISTTAYGFKGIKTSDTKSIEESKQRLEGLVNIYVRYMYGLKNQDFNLDPAKGGIDLEKIDEDTLSVIWQMQKQHEISFKMPLPKTIPGQYKAFEDTCKMIPGIRFMYDDLKGRDVDWAQIVNKPMETRLVNNPNNPNNPLVEAEPGAIE